MTPMMQQFYDLKKKHPDALLLFRCGDFYETYMQDAEKSSKILGITLTKRSKTRDIDGKPLAMAGFPYRALDTYLPKLIRAGQRVAICDQIDNTQQVAETVTKNTEQQITNKDNMTTETALLEEAKKQIIGIAVETIKALNGNVPTSLNKRLSDSIGALEYIRLKYTNNAKIFQDEMDYILRLAEVGLQHSNK